MKKLYILIGKTGSGKDTQIKLLAKKHAVVLIRIGDDVRELAKTNTLIAQQLQNGEMVDDNLVNQIFADKFTTESENTVYISDGFPRVLEQAIWLNNFLEKHNGQIAKVFLLIVSDQTVHQRLALRGRSDDKTNIINKRIKLFNQVTSKVIEFYRQKRLLVEIDGSGTVEEINQLLENQLT